MKRLPGPVFLIAAIAITFGILMLLPALTTRAAAVLNYGQAANGTLNANQKTEYTLQGKAGDKLSIAMNTVGGDIDPFLDLYDPQGKLIGEDDNSGGKDNAYLNGIVLSADGAYKLVAVNLRQSAGQYSLVVNRQVAQGKNTDVIRYDGTQDREAYSLSQPWDHTNITYRLENGLPGFSAQESRTVIQEALQSWASVTPLTFQEVTSGQSDLDIQFAPIDGALNVLGETCPPSSPCAGQVQFDSDEPWVLRQPTGYQDISLLGVASHEFGHAIGLLHSSDASALMYPTYSPYNLKPAQDDIQGAQRLYGAGAGRVANQPTPAPNNSGQPQVRGTITDNRFVNFWDFDVDAGETVTISMKRASGNLDSLLVLLDANDRILAYSDDDAGSRDAVLRNIRLPQRGTYSVAATRYQQAQGFTTGDYTLTINYGPTNAPPPAPTSASQPGQIGQVKVSAGQANTLAQLLSLDTTLNSAFNESPSPQTQMRNATVNRSQSYAWDATWCARDPQTLDKNLADITVSFAVNDQPIDSKLITRTNPRNGPNGLTCADFFVVLSDWSAGQVSLTKTLTLRNPVFDGLTIYEPGDYVYKYTVQVQ